jgi:hypothetical protein
MSLEMLDLRANLIGQIDDVNNLQDVNRFPFSLYFLDFSLCILAPNVNSFPSAEL